MQVLPDCTGCLHWGSVKVVPSPLPWVSSKHSKSTGWGSSKELDQPYGMAWTLEKKTKLHDSMKCMFSDYINFKWILWNVSEYIRELLSFMMAGPSLSFRPLKLICCYGKRFRKRVNTTLNCKLKKEIQTLTHLNDWLNVDIFIEVNKPIPVRNICKTYMHINNNPVYTNITDKCRKRILLFKRINYSINSSNNSTQTSYMTWLQYN